MPRSPTAGKREIRRGADPVTPSGTRLFPFPRPEARRTRPFFSGSKLRLAFPKERNFPREGSPGRRFSVLNRRYGGLRKLAF